MGHEGSTRALGTAGVTRVQTIVVCSEVHSIGEPGFRRDWAHIRRRAADINVVIIGEFDTGCVQPAPQLNRTGFIGGPF